MNKESKIKIKQEQLEELAALKAGYQERLSHIEKDEAELKNEIESPQKVGRWKPDGEMFYMVEDSTKILKVTNMDWSYREDAYRIGNCFQTEAQAERYRDFLLLLTELHDFALEKNEGWFPDFSSDKDRKYFINVEYGKLDVDYYYQTNVSVLPFFKSRDIADQAINHFGDRLHLLFDYYNKPI